MAIIDNTSNKLSLIQILTLGFTLVIFILIMLNLGYATPRSNFIPFFFQYCTVFLLFYFIWLNRWQLKFYHFLILAIIVRLTLIGAIPALSNDFFRFIWDGELLTQGINPFAHKPNEIINNYPIFSSEYKRLLYLGMGSLSQEHYTCYPVINQIFFFIPAAFSESIVGNIIGLKIIIILADIGAIYFAKKIAEKLNLSSHVVWLYALNPFVILEFTGNLHFEGVMICFLLAAIYALLKYRWILAGVCFAIAIQIKLIPLILLPFALKHLKIRFSIGFLAVVALTTLTIGTMMLNEVFLENMMSSVNAYFIRFQFNASIFYLIREIGFQTVGWDPIQFVGPILSYIAASMIILLAVFKAYRNELDIVKGMMFALMIYYLFATTVHPWYVGTILALSIFTRYKFALIWSFLVMLSYVAYLDPNMVKEDPLLLIIEYSLVILVMSFEIYRYTKRDALGIQLKSFFSSQTI